MDKKRKELEIIRHYVCEACKDIISGPYAGFVFHGNVYVGAPGGGGLIGNNFPKAADAPAKEVAETALCLRCTCRALGFHFDKIGEDQILDWLRACLGEDLSEHKIREKLKLWINHTSPSTPLI